MSHSPYLQTLLNPINAPITSIPDMELTPHVLKQLQTVATITNTVNTQPLLFVWKYHSNLLYVRVYVRDATTKKFNLWKLISPSQDLYGNFDYFRPISGILSTRSATQSVTNLVISGTINAVDTQAVTDVRSMNYESLLKYAVSSGQKVGSVLLAEGVVQILPPYSGKYQAPNPASFTLTYNNYQSEYPFSGNIPNQAKTLPFDGAALTVGGNNDFFLSKSVYGCGSVVGRIYFTGTLGAQCAMTVSLIKKYADPSTLAESTVYRDVYSDTRIGNGALMPVDFDTRWFEYTDVVGFRVVITGCNSATINFENVCFDYFAANFARQHMMIVQDYVANQQIVLSGALNVEAVPNAELAQNIGQLTLGAANETEVAIAETLFSKLDNVYRTVWTNSDYQRFIQSRVSSHTSKEGIVANTASIAPVLSGLWSLFGDKAIALGKSALNGAASGVSSYFNNAISSSGKIGNTSSRSLNGWDTNYLAPGRLDKKYKGMRPTYCCPSCAKGNIIDSGDLNYVICKDCDTAFDIFTGITVDIAGKCCSCQNCHPSLIGNTLVCKNDGAMYWAGNHPTLELEPRYRNYTNKQVLTCNKTPIQNGLTNEQLISLIRAHLSPNYRELWPRFYKKSNFEQQTSKIASCATKSDKELLAQLLAQAAALQQKLEQQAEVKPIAVKAAAAKQDPTPRYLLPVADTLLGSDDGQASRYKAVLTGEEAIHAKQVFEWNGKLHNLTCLGAAMYPALLHDKSYIGTIFRTAGPAEVAYLDGGRETYFKPTYKEVFQNVFVDQLLIGSEQAFYDNMLKPGYYTSNLNGILEGQNGQSYEAALYMSSFCYYNSYVLTGCISAQVSNVRDKLNLCQQHHVNLLIMGETDPEEGDVVRRIGVGLTRQLFDPKHEVLAYSFELTSAIAASLVGASKVKGGMTEDVKEALERKGTGYFPVRVVANYKEDKFDQTVDIPVIRDAEDGEDAQDYDHRPLLKKYYHKLNYETMDDAYHSLKIDRTTGGFKPVLVATGKKNADGEQPTVADPDGYSAMMAIWNALYADNPSFDFPDFMQDWVDMKNEAHDWLGEHKDNAPPKQKNKKKGGASGVVKAAPVTKRKTVSESVHAKNVANNKPTFTKPQAQQQPKKKATVKRAKPNNGKAPARNANRAPAADDDDDIWGEQLNNVVDD